MGRFESTAEFYARCRESYPPESRKVAEEIGSVDDIASVAVMLSGNDNMTGQTISVNGGWYMS
jgi:NAD(P)-dependent dehydrogenase (short-subunit alcohol dehydrogenase family)